MKNWLGLYAIALAIALLASMWFGLPVGTVAALGLVIGCLLMIVLMKYGRGAWNVNDRDTGESYDPHRHTPGR